jgi:hypothetical protein
MRLQSPNRELEAKDNVSVRRLQHHPNKRNNWAAMSSSDGNQLATGKKERRVVKVKKEEEFGIKKAEEIENDLHQDKDEDSRKPPAIVKEEEDVTEEECECILVQLDRDETEDCKKLPAAVKQEEGYETEEKADAEGDLQLNRDEPEDCKKPPAAVKKEEEDVTGEKADDESDLKLDRDEPEDCKKPPAAVKKEEEDVTGEDGEGDLELNRDEPEDCKKLPAAVKKEEVHEVGHEYSPVEIDEKSNWEQLATRGGTTSKQHISQMRILVRKVYCLWHALPTLIPVLKQLLFQQ